MLRDYKELVGQYAFEEATEIVPFEFGKLRASGIFKVHRDGFSIIFPLSYANIQHENLSYSHPGKKSRSPNMARASRGKAKYAAIPVREGTKQFLKHARKLIR